jgi:hypothetical protein
LIHQKDIVMANTGHTAPTRTRKSKIQKGIQARNPNITSTFPSTTSTPNKTNRSFSPFKASLIAEKL